MNYRSTQNSTPPNRNNTQNLVLGILFSTKQWTNSYTTNRERMGSSSMTLSNLQKNDFWPRIQEAVEVLITDEVTDLTVTPLPSESCDLMMENTVWSSPSV